jgi:hypothetical protein
MAGIGAKLSESGHFRSVHLTKVVPLGHRLLHRDRAAHRVDDARKFPPAGPSHLVDCGGARPA